MDLCRWCNRLATGGKDHIIMRSKDRSLINDPRNKRPLCITCHDARHGRKSIDYSTDPPFSCPVCRFFTICVTGQRVYANQTEESLSPETLRPGTD